MIVQIFEPYQGGGHCTNYIEALLPPLVDLVQKGDVQKVIVTISRAHRESWAFADQLSKFSSAVHFEASMPVIWGVTKSPILAKALLDSVARFRPDYLIATTADLVSVGLAGRSFAGQSLPRGIHSVGIFHYGRVAEHGDAGTIRSRMKNAIFRAGRSVSPWSEVQIVNPLDYERMKEGCPNLGRIRLLPDPVGSFARIDKAAAREALGIPVEGRYIGFIGASDKRKAIPELLSAFRAATSSREDRLLLAGRLYEPYNALIQRDFQDLARQGRLLVLDRYLTTEELNVCFCALDVAAVTFYPGTGLSGSLLRAAFAGRQVVAGANGYTGMAVGRFELGWSCDVHNHEEFVGAVRRALDENSSYRPGEKLARLIAFHNPKNYANSVLGALYERIGLSAPEMITWEWATSQDGKPIRGCGDDSN